METNRKEPVSSLFSPTLFGEPAVVAVRRQFGAKGEMTVVKLLCEIALNGYYAEWSGEVRHRLLGMLPGVSSSLPRMIVAELVMNGFVENVLFDCNVLTSEVIQHRCLYRKSIISSSRIFSLTCLLTVKVPFLLKKVWFLRKNHGILPKKLLISVIDA